MMSCTSLGSLAKRALFIVRPCQVMAPKPTSVYYLATSVSMKLTQPEGNMIQPL